MNVARTACALAVMFWLSLGTAEAEFVGLNIGAQLRAPKLSNSFAPPGDSSIDLVDDLDVEDPTHTSMVLILEHPIAVLPNIRYQGFKLDSTGRSTLSSDLSFNGETFPTGDEVTSTYDLTHDDIVLYYQLLDNRVNLDLGVDLKRFDGEVSLSSSTRTSVSVDETIPLLYLSARYDLPKSGFYVGANINANFVDLGLSGSTARDSTIMLGYESRSGLGLEGGYKSFLLDLDELNSPDTSLEYDGIYLNGYFNF